MDLKVRQVKFKILRYVNDTIIWLQQIIEKAPRPKFKVENIF